MNTPSKSNGIHWKVAEAAAERRECFTSAKHYGTGKRVYVWLLAASLQMGCLMAAEEHMPISTAAKATEVRDTTSWEEPTLFPLETPESAPASSTIRKARRPDLAYVSSPPPPQSDTPSSDSQFPKAAFQTEFGNFSGGTNLVGLESARQRDAIMARIQSDPATQPYNFKIGRIPFRLSDSFEAEFTDNILRSDRDRKSEFSILPRLDISGSVKLSSKTSLSLGVGIGYIKYLGGHEKDRLLTLASVSPDTGLSLDIKIGKFLISVFDKPTLPQFQEDANTQRTPLQYNQFTNTAGLSVLWNINSRTNASFRYSHSNAISVTSTKNNSDGATDSFLASLSTQLSESLGVGIEAGSDTSTYTTDVVNEGTTYHVGPFISYELSRFLRVRASFGYQGGSYSSNAQSGDTSALGTYYASISFSNSLNTHFMHSLSLGREAQRGSFSNFTETEHISYQASWDLIRKVTLSGFASFEDSKESGGIFVEHFHSFQCGVTCGLNLTDRISLGLAYSFTKRTTVGDTGPQSGFLDFSENRITLRLGYAF